MLAMFVFGGAVMAAAFMLASAAEAAEIDLSPGIAVGGRGVRRRAARVRDRGLLRLQRARRVRDRQPDRQHAAAAGLRGRDARDRIAIHGPARQAADRDRGAPARAARRPRGDRGRLALRAADRAPRAPGVAGRHRPDRTVRRVHAPHRRPASPSLRTSWAWRRSSAGCQSASVSAGSPGSWFSPPALCWSRRSRSPTRCC